jgi:hypothetical protein
VSICYADHCIAPGHRLRVISKYFIAECFGTRFDYEALMSEHALDDETEILKRCGT